jgi:hypothetical protein
MLGCRRRLFKFGRDQPVTYSQRQLARRAGVDPTRSKIVSVAMTRCSVENRHLRL